MIRKKLNSTMNSINAAALLLGAASLLSRILGVLRDRLLASHFGASRELDIYYAAFQIPDFLFNLFLIGAASTAIIPIFLETKEQDENKAGELIHNLLKIFLIATTAVSLLMIFLMPFFMHLVTPGFSDKERMTTAVLAQIMMASPILLGLSSIISSVIQSFRKFFVFALSPIFYNIGIILGIIFFLPIFGLPGLALGVILGALLHLLVQFIAFLDLGFGKFLGPGHGGEKTFSRPILKILRLSVPRVIAVSISNITAIFLVAISSTLLAGSISIFSFSDNLSGLPIGIFGVSFAVAAFPILSEQFLKKNSISFFETFYDSLRSISFWIFPMAVFFFVLRAQIVRVTLGAGKFSWTDTRLTAASLGIMTISIFANSIIPVLIRSFYALGNTRRPLIINLFTAIFTVALAYLFIPILSHVNYFSHMFARILKVEDIRNIGVLGVALALSVGSFSDLVLLTRGSLKEAKRKFNIKKEDMPASPWKEIIKMLTAAIASGFSGFGILRLVNIFITLDTFLGVLIQGAVSFAAGLLIYALILYALGNKEIRQVIEVFRKHLSTLRVLPRALDGDNL